MNTGDGGPGPRGSRPSRRSAQELAPPGRAGRGAGSGRRAGRPRAAAASRRRGRPGPAPEALSEELVLVIGAAVAAFLGKRPHIRQIRLLGSDGLGPAGPRHDPGVARPAVALPEEHALKLKITVDGKVYEVEVEVFEPEPPQPGYVPPPARPASPRRAAVARAPGRRAGRRARWPTRARSAAARSRAWSPASPPRSGRPSRSTTSCWSWRR